jgi:DNA-binding LacI/PurR family transcriptional regulator|tara:strand:- start:64 stop:645 length:582 start_codon:yes stop_codon:yes gene_type:complete
MAKGAEGKSLIAWKIREETSVPLAWIAAELSMGSASNVSAQVRRMGERVAKQRRLRRLLKGMRDAMEQHGHSFNRDWIFEGDPSSAVFLRKILAEGKPDALVGANDPIAALLLQGLAKAKINVPGDIRVVGFDDCGFATLVSPPLTTIHQPCREIALACFRTMEGRFENPLLPPRNISLPAQLVIRESCGAYL